MRTSVKGEADYYIFLKLRVTRNATHLGTATVAHKRRRIKSAEVEEPPHKGQALTLPA